MWVRKKFGPVVVIDPYHLVVKTTSSVNVLDFIKKDSPTAIDDCRQLSKVLVARTGNEHEMHWLDYAERVIETIIAFVVFYAPSDDRSLHTVIGIISNQEELRGDKRYASIGQCDIGKDGRTAHVSRG